MANASNQPQRLGRPVEAPYSLPAYDQLWYRVIDNVSRFGFLGVALFFVISGFCIHLRTARVKRDTGEFTLDWQDFWWRRFHRLYPPYFIMLVISMSLWIYLYSTGGANIYPTRSKSWLVWDFVSHVLMLHGFHPALDEGAGNAVYWTLAREEYLYLMYAGLLLYFRRTLGVLKSLCVVLTLGVASYIVTAALVPGDSPWQSVVERSPLFLWIQWTLGMVAVEAYYGIIRLPRWCYWLPLVPVWFVVGYFCSEYFSALAPAAWGMAFFTLLNYCVGREADGKWPNGFAFRWLFSIGVFSYSLYLVHTVVIAGVDRLTSGRPAFGPLIATLCAFGLTLCCVVAGKIYYTVVEKHFLNSSPTVSHPNNVAERFKFQLSDFKSG